MQISVLNKSYDFDFEFHLAAFCLALCSFRPPSLALVDYYLERGELSVHDVVGVNYKNSPTTENQGAGDYHVG